jgi:cytochrome c
MSDLTFNKIAGGVLAAGLAIFGLKEVSSILFEQHELEKPGYAITVQEEAGGAAVAEVPPDWGTVLPTADIAAGQAITAKCASCHNFVSGGPNGTGPNLFGVVGRAPASHPGFAYSDGMKAYGAANPVWTFEKIDNFIHAPQKDVAGTKMTFIGLKVQQDRINVIAYLHSLGSTLPIPAPNPAAAAPAEAPAQGAAPAGAPVPGAAAPAAGATPSAATPTTPGPAATTSTATK